MEEKKEVKELLEKQLQIEADDDIYNVTVQEMEELIASKAWKEMRDMLKMHLQMNYMLVDSFTTVEEVYVNKGRNKEIGNLITMPEFILGELVKREKEVKEEEEDKQFEQKFKNSRRI